MHRSVFLIPCLATKKKKILIFCSTFDVGMVDSKEFAVGIFDALARRRRQRIEKISKEELHDFWLQISDQSFDARLQIFFDM